MTRKWATDGEEPKYLRDVSEGRPNRYGPDDITYSYNDYGFRTTNFSTLNRASEIVMAVGCSNTEGIGLPEHHTWPYLLTDMFALAETGPFTNLNLGAGGSSNRHIALRTIRGIRTLRPHRVFVAWTYPHRLQYVYEKNSEIHDWWALNEAEMKSTANSEKLRLKKLYFEQLQSDPFDLHGLATDIQMVSLAALAFEIPVCHSLIYLDVDVQGWIDARFDNTLTGWFGWSPTARDLQHPGVECNQWVATQMFNWWKNR
jgi:hypothetical protein